MIKQDALYIGYYYFVIKKDNKTEERFDLIEEFDQDIFSNTMKASEKLKQKYNIGNVDIDTSTIYLELLLKIERQQSGTTHLESINVSINPQLSEEPPQILKCNLMNMNTVLNNLVLYGTGLMKNDIPKLVNVIQTKYRFLNVHINIEEDTLSNRFFDIVCMFKDVIDKAENDLAIQNAINKSTKIEDTSKKDAKQVEVEKNKKKEHTFTITVGEFKEYIETTEFEKYGVSAIREKLRDFDITICNDKRTDYTEKRGKDAVKVIKFDVNNMNKYINDNKPKVTKLPSYQVLSKVDIL
jgi:hypothetical protein